MSARVGGAETGSQTSKTCSGVYTDDLPAVCSEPPSEYKPPLFTF